VRVPEILPWGCAGRRRLQAALLQPDFYCPIIRGNRPRLPIRMAANRDLAKLNSSRDFREELWRQWEQGHQ
jgi:hypothetical protein